MGEAGGETLPAGWVSVAEAARAGRAPYRPEAGRSVIAPEAVEALFPDLFRVVDFASPLYAEKMAGLFAAAKHGAVLISPCVTGGVDVFLSQDSLSKMIKVKYHTVPDAIRALGPIASIQAGFLELQKNVYAA